MENILERIKDSIGITDIIDILVVAFLIYALLQYLRETRAEQLLKGALLFVLAMMAAQWLHLYTLHWILSSLVTVGVLALVIIFQPEIRRGLDHLGRRTIAANLFGTSDDGAVHMIEQLVGAVIDMSESKTGALIVMERGTTLSEIVETGTVIDAEVSDQLIENIFYEGAPLHDGAVIIRENRVMAAGCVLPLTDNQRLAKQLGTRHRAGIGISENSDALVIIVSEETGIISTAEDGKLNRGYGRESLEKLIRSSFANEASDNPLDKLFSGKKAKGVQQND